MYLANLLCFKNIGTFFLGKTSVEMVQWGETCPPKKMNMHFSNVAHSFLLYSYFGVSIRHIFVVSILQRLTVFDTEEWKVEFLMGNVKRKNAWKFPEKWPINLLSPGKENWFQFDIILYCFSWWGSVTTRPIVPWDILQNPSLMFAQLYLRNITSTKLHIKQWICVLPLFYFLILQVVVSKLLHVHPYFGGNGPIWQAFFRWVETTN